MKAGEASGTITVDGFEPANFTRIIGIEVITNVHSKRNRPSLKKLDHFILAVVLQRLKVILLVKLPFELHMWGEESAEVEQENNYHRRSQGSRPEYSVIAADEKY